MLRNLATDANLSVEEAKKIYYDQKEFAKAKLTYKYRKGKPLVANKGD